MYTTGLGTYTVHFISSYSASFVTQLVFLDCISTHTIIFEVLNKSLKLATVKNATHCESQ